MAPRDPSRPKASDIPDVDMLRAVDAWNETRAIHPLDAFHAIPRKVSLEKLRKLEARGLIVRPNRTGYAVTPFGREVMNA